MCIRDRYHIAHESQCQDQKNGENNTKDLAKKSFNCSMDVINRPACYFSVLYCFIILCKSSFCINGCHAKESGQDVYKRQVIYQGNFKIAGVPTPASPIKLKFIGMTTTSFKAFESSSKVMFMLLDAFTVCGVIPR